MVRSAATTTSKETTKKVVESGVKKTAVQPSNLARATGDAAGAAGKTGASGADNIITGFKGSNGFELKNAPYQPVRNVAGKVNGRPYSGHAFDQMQNRGIMPSVVDNTIANGVQFPGKAGTTVYYDAINRVRVITNSQTGNVITVFRGKP